VPLNKQFIPDIALVEGILPTDSDQVIRRRAYSALPRLIADLARQAGEAAWRDMPLASDMADADKERLIKETADAYERNLTQRQMNEIVDEVVRRLKEQNGQAPRGRRR
jgi:hypothetical protein